MNPSVLILSLNAVIPWSSIAGNASRRGSARIS